MVGEEAAALRRALEISYPVENGTIRVCCEAVCIVPRSNAYHRP